MTIYLDVSCLNRPFDDQRQERIRLESEAVMLILKRIEEGELEQVSSEIAVKEIEATPDDDRRERVSQLLPPISARHILTTDAFLRAADLVRLGFKPADALHVAAAAESQVEVLLSCDDRMCRVARRHQSELRIRVVNPLDWLKEQGDVADE